MVCVLIITASRDPHVFAFAQMFSRRLTIHIVTVQLQYNEKRESEMVAVYGVLLDSKITWFQ